MAYVSPPAHTASDLVTSADWNQYIKANWESLSGLIAYVNGAALSGWTEFTAAQGLFILGLVSGGTLATAVGTPLTNQQNVTHTHTITHTGWGHTTITDNGGIIQITANTGNFEGATGAATSGTASAGSIGVPYIQLRCIRKS